VPRGIEKPNKRGPLWCAWHQIGRLGSPIIVQGRSLDVAALVIEYSKIHVRTNVNHTIDQAMTSAPSFQASPDDR
jgi:hypothetical protein